MRAYSVDLREKIVAAVRRGMSKAQAARTLGVGATSVKRYVKLIEQGNPLSPGKAPPDKKGKPYNASWGNLTAKCCLARLDVQAMER